MAICRSEREFRGVIECFLARMSGCAEAKVYLRVLAMKFGVVESKFQDAKNNGHVITFNLDSTLSGVDVT